MKHIRKILALSFILCLCITETAWATDLTWENVPGHHNQSVILNSQCLSSKDTVRRNARGEFLAEASAEIVNNQNGEILITLETLAYRTVDAIYHSAFLDMWDENLHDWVQVGYWEFERRKEEQDGDLSILFTSLTATGYEVNRIYRVRGLHMVELGDEAEGCATETNGVLITDHET